MGLLSDWFTEVSSLENSVILTLGGTKFCYYKGFRFSEEGVEDLRNSDFYSIVSEGDLKRFKDLGVICGCNYINFLRNRVRIKHYNSRLTKVTESRDSFVERLKQAPNDKFIVKRVRNFNDNIKIIEETLDFYKSQVEIAKNKFKFK